MKKQNFKLQLKKVSIANLATIRGGGATKVSCDVQECPRTYDTFCDTHTTKSETQETERECDTTASKNDNSLTQGTTSLVGC